MFPLIMTVLAVPCSPINKAAWKKKSELKRVKGEDCWDPKMPWDGPTWRRKEAGQKKKHLAEKSYERAGKMGLIWGEALAIAQVTVQDRVEWRRFDCGLLFQPEWSGWVRVSYLCLDDFSSLNQYGNLPFPVWTQSGWGSPCARYPRLEQGWRGSQGCDLSDICIPPHDCSSAPIRLWFQIHQNKTLSISAVSGYTTRKSIGKLDTRIWF